MASLWANLATIALLVLPEPTTVTRTIDWWRGRCTVTIGSDGETRHQDAPAKVLELQSGTW